MHEAAAGRGILGPASEAQLSHKVEPLLFALATPPPHPSHTCILCDPRGACPRSLLSVPVNSTTHEWQVTDPSLGAGLALGPSGATVLTRDPVKGQDAYEQTVRVGPDGVVLGPNKASAQVNRTADLAQGTLGIDNLHLGRNGVLINNGSPLNSSVKVSARWLGGPCAPMRCGSSLRLSLDVSGCAGDSEWIHGPGQPHWVWSEPLLCQAKPEAGKSAGAATARQLGQEPAASWGRPATGCLVCRCWARRQTGR